MSAKRFAIIGLGQYGLALAERLLQLGAEVLAIDKDPDVLDAVEGRADLQGAMHTVCLDATDQRAMENVGIEDVDAAVVAIGQHIEVSVLVTAILRGMGVSRIVARASTRLHEHVLEQVGASEVHNPELEAAVRDAERLYRPPLAERGTIPGTGQHVLEVEVPPQFVNKPLSEMQLEDRGVVLLALAEPTMDVGPRGESRVVRSRPRPPHRDIEPKEGTRLFLAGEPHALAELIEAWR